MLFVPQWIFPADVVSNDLATVAGDDEVGQLSLSARLEYFKAHGERPPSSRIDPFLEQRVHNAPLSLVNLWKYGAFLATKATDIASDLVRHQLIGARKKSWGVEMTILSALMRNMGSHSSLADLRMLRKALAVGTALTPVAVPGDALVTPVTFRARKRGLRGFLADVDAKEDGRRVLGGEWVVCRSLWLRLQDQWRKSRKHGHAHGGGGGGHSHGHGHHGGLADESGGGVAAGSSRAPPPTQSRVILFLHGGAYYMFSPATHRTLTIPLSKQTESRVFAVDYRLAPETRFPGQLHDAVLAYLRLVEDLDIPPANIVVCGDSAGGGLALSLLLYLRDNSYPLPSACILMSPWVDLTMSCDSWDSNAEFDLVPIPRSGDHLNPILCLLGPAGLSNQYLTHPYASPLFGQMHGLPPLLIQSGDAEVLRDEAMLLAHKATLAGVKVRHEIYEDQVHVFQMFWFLDSAKKALLACGDFLHSLAHDTSVTRHKRSLSGVALSATEKDTDYKAEDAVTAGAPESLTKEAEARLDREIVGEGSKVMLVRGDGTVVDENATDIGADLLMDLESETSSESPTLAQEGPGSRSPSFLSTGLLARGRQDPHVRDGTCVDTGAKALDEDQEYDEPDSPISFKPRRRSPNAAGAVPSAPGGVDSEPFPRPPSAASNVVRSPIIRAKTPISIPTTTATARRRASGYFSNTPNPTISVSPTKSMGRTMVGRVRSGSASQPYTIAPAPPGVLTRNNSIGSGGAPAPNSTNTSMSAKHLSRRRTQMNLSLTTSSPYNPTSSAFSFNPSMVTSTQVHGHGYGHGHGHGTPHSPLLSPSVPSIRKRERATSHPDIFRLCQSWAERGPANDLVVIEANPHPHVGDES